jgi:hypothetical protein
LDGGKWLDEFVLGFMKAWTVVLFSELEQRLMIPRTALQGLKLAATRFG